MSSSTRHLLARLALFPLVLLLGPSIARATIFVTGAQAPIVERADTIALGVVQKVSTRWEGRRIVSDVELDVEETVKGTPARHLRFVAPGGRVGDVVMRVVDGAEFRVADRSIVFLGERSGVRRLVGLGAGKLEVQGRADAAQVTLRSGAGVEVVPLRRALDELRTLAQRSVR